MTLQELKSAIWNHRRIRRNLVDLQVYADKAGITLPITEVHHAEKLLKSLTNKIKHKTETPKWCIERYESAHKVWFANEYPNAFKDGHYLEPKWPDVGTTNGITNFVIDYITWVGGYANRLNVMGRKINDTYIPSTTKKGTEDIDCLWKGRKIAIEIKNRTTKDTVKDDQVKQRKRIESAGGIYIIVTGVENFFNQWDIITNSLP